MKNRFKYVQIFFLFWTITLIVRLFYWQVIKASELQSQAERQYASVSTILARRGEILSNDYFPIVSGVERFSMYAHPLQYQPNQKDLLNKIMEILPSTGSARKNLGLIPLIDQKWIHITHGISPGQKDLITRLEADFLGFESEAAREYPEGSSSAYLTGFLGKDELGNPKGYFGLEGYYDRLLAGKSGRVEAQEDPFSQPINISEENLLPAQNGSTLLTSIDRTLQYLVFKKLESGIQKYQADSGTASVMETKTGRILAMVALPGYDPANYSEYESISYKNPVISEFYEPGSTFKAVVMASALDIGVVTPDSLCPRCSGPIRLSGMSIHNYDDKYHPHSTMTEVILHSDNVGMVNVAQMMGRDKLLGYIKKFGFGKLTGIDLQEESTPLIRPEAEWREVDWGTASFGQGIAVTRIQLLTAVNAIANNGILIAPQVVTGILSGNTSKPVSPKIGERVISVQAAEQMVEMMVNGVEKGEVRYYKPSGFRIAGKTGTAQVPIEGHYDKTSSIASFVGFAPSDNPRFTMLVTLRNPKTAQWGSTSAAPIWFDISKELFRYLKIIPYTP